MVPWLQIGNLVKSTHRGSGWEKYTLRRQKRSSSQGSLQSNESEADRDLGIITLFDRWGRNECAQQHHPEASERRTMHGLTPRLELTHHLTLPTETLKSNALTTERDSLWQGQALRVKQIPWIDYNCSSVFIFTSHQLQLGVPAKLRTHPSHIPCHRHTHIHQQNSVSRVSPVSFFPLKPSPEENELLKEANPRVDFWWWPERRGWSKVRKCLMLSSVY